MAARTFTARTEPVGGTWLYADVETRCLYSALGLHAIGLGENPMLWAARLRHGTAPHERPRAAPLP
jgi:hypothetical protein